MRLTRVHCAAPLAQGGEATLPDAAANVYYQLSFHEGSRYPLDRGAAGIPA